MKSAFLQILMDLKAIEIIFWVLIYVLGVNKSISAVKITIHHFVSLKSSVLFKIWSWWPYSFYAVMRIKIYNFIVGSPKSVKN